MNQVLSSGSAGFLHLINIKIVFLLLLLSQLRSNHFKFLTAAQNYTDLPIVEVNGLLKLMSSLELKAKPVISPTYCVHMSTFSPTITIRCEAVNGTWHVSAITMNDVDLTGEISKDIAVFTYLNILDLYGNKIHGCIPHEIGSLSNLISLDLSKNQLTGIIPASLGDLRNLNYLYLKMNFLTGNIPKSLGSLSSLLSLDLWSNKLTGEIPRELGNLAMLSYFDVSENGLNGTLPSELGKLSFLQKLEVASNNLTGHIPKAYENLKNLNGLNVGGNNLSGHIPKFVANLVNLYYLNLMGNNFQGELPSEIFKMSRLQYLYVTDLQTESFAFPMSANLSNIEKLVLRNCSINGPIPPYIANWTEIEELDLSFNNLSGEIPNAFKNLTLDSLYLTGNMLNGTLQDWIYSNRTKGDLSYNKFKFPETHENRPKENSLINLEPRTRNFSEEITRNNCSPDKKGSKYYHNLYINAGGEEYSDGPIKYEADNSTSNFYINKPAYNWAYSCNGDFFSGDIVDVSTQFIQKESCGISVNDASLYEKARICPTSLNYYGFCLEKGNYTVTLHFSEIVFKGSDNYSSLAKRVFDIYIQGELKRKDFNIKEEAEHTKNRTVQNFTATVKDDHVLEIGLYWAGKGSLYIQPYLNGPLISAIAVTPNFKVNLPGGGLSKKWIAVIVVAAVLALILCFALMWRLGWIGDRELRVSTVNLRGKSYTLRQVKDGTRNFSPRNVIGTGRFGTVYKAELPDQTVAVKVLSSQSKQVIDQIGTEVYALTTLKHENIVEFLDGYSKTDLNLLIYEYMERGSLQRALFDANSSTRLDWPTRVSICLGIAKGLKYLHEDNPSRKIIHRNIKPSNILLDGNLNAKVSDLGLAKLYDEENPYKFIQEKGTLVYMAPEYAMRKAITEKVDVFSFGIVLLEIVSGQTNANYESNQETVFLLDTAIVLHAKGRLSELVDKQMPNTHKVQKQAKQILELAMRCVDQSPTLRPTMSEAVNELQHIST